MPGEKMGWKSIILSNKFLVECENDPVQYEVYLRAVRKVFKDSCGIDLRKFRASKNAPAPMGAPLLRGRIPDEKIKAAMKAFREFVRPTHDKAVKGAYGWTMVITGRKIQFKKGDQPVQEENRTIREAEIRRDLERKATGRDRTLPDWILREFPNCVAVDADIDETLRADVANLEGWEGRVYHDLSRNLDIVIYYLRQVKETPQAPAPEVPYPEDPGYYQAQGARDACKARNDAWVRTIDPSYDPSRRDRTGPGALGGSLFCANMALHRKGFRKDEDPSRYDVVLPSPDELGLVRCTDRCDLPMALIRSEVSVDNVRSRGNGMTVDVTVTNPGNQPMTVRIPQGMAFEVDSPELGVQSLVASKTIEIPLKPGETRTVPVDCFCANSRFQSPIGSLMKITPYKTAVALGTQDAVWNYFGRGDSYGGGREGIYRYR